MKELLKQKISESISSVLPITLIVLILSFTNLAPMPAGMLILFLLGSVMLIVGMGFFSLGTDLSMMPMGTEVGRSISASKKMIIIVFLCFLIGFAVTVAEPDLQVLAKQFTAVPDLTIILTVAAGVGLFLIIAALREFWGIRLQSTLIVLYAIVFLISFFVKPEFLPVAFDSGGVTTGPITVPFRLHWAWCGKPKKCRRRQQFWPGCNLQRWADYYHAAYGNCVTFHRSYAA